MVSSGYIDYYIEISERVVTKMLTVNSDDFHIYQDNFLNLKYNNKCGFFLMYFY